MSSESVIVTAASPPPGVSSNFVDPESCSRTVIKASIICLVFSFSICCLRLYTRKCIVRSLHFDDAFLALAMAFAIAFSATTIVQTKHGLGRHMWDVPLTDFVEFVKIGVISGAMSYNISLMCTKVSILLFYLRFPSAKGFRISTYIVMAVAVGNSLAAATPVLYLCQPIARLWDRNIEGSCRDTDAPFLVTAIVNIVTDVVILALPIWLLKPLRMVPLMKKIGITMVMMTGGFVCAVSMIRLAEIKIGKAAVDFTWSCATNLIWALIETHVAIICACLPCLKAFTKRYFSNMRILRPAFHTQQVFTIRTTETIIFRTSTEGSAGSGKERSPASTLSPMLSERPKVAVLDERSLP